MIKAHCDFLAEFRNINQHPIITSMRLTTNYVMQKLCIQVAQGGLLGKFVQKLATNQCLTIIKIVNRMKEEITRANTRQSQLCIETDIEESLNLCRERKFQRNTRSCTYQKKRRVKRLLGVQIVSNLAYNFKIYRFPLKNLKKTLRAYCFKEVDLNWPHRFTDRLKSVSIDNDKESCQSLIQQEIKMGIKSLREAVLSYEKQQQV